MRQRDLRPVPLGKADDAILALARAPFASDAQHYVRVLRQAHADTRLRARAPIEVGVHGRGHVDLVVVQRPAQLLRDGL